MRVPFALPEVGGSAPTCPPPAWLGACIVVLALSACAGGGPRPRSVPPTAPVETGQPRAPTRTTPRDPSFQASPGLENVIGADRKELVQLFGEPRLDVWEGDARKLQFAGTACLLDVYLYPTSRSREPQASYVDARRASDGQDVDRAACVAALRQR